ncbi:hypothetical protein D7294_30380 [Streptomyces hoynatensis]|uniref:Large polyvalent protein associated domain-containing protein n=1 Tax=Streptomyces hoynatensis TaxID=1141874 RepID=A0A3A9YFU1_9ACTN|nr:hypothetical protein D7294_30380 [Streptomyces hoynatensis]
MAAARHTVTHALTQGVERFNQAYEYVYGNAISQPISTAVLMSQRPGDILSPSEWSRTWTAANYISPGQAVMLPYAGENVGVQLLGASQTFTPGANILLNHLLGDPDAADKAVGSSLVHYVPPGIENAVPGWEDMGFDEQQRILADMGMPVDPRGGNAYIAQLRSRSLNYRLLSGGFDFAVRWYADPITHGLRGAGAARRAMTTAARPSGGWTQGQIADLINNSRTQQLINFLNENRGNPALISNTDMAIRSGMGPRLGAINEVLRNADEVQEFIRVGMGDVAAQERLAQSNALARQRLDAYRSRLSLQESYLAQTTVRGPRAEQMRALAMQERQRIQEAINADEALVNRHNQILEHADEIDRLYYGRGQYRRARRRTAAQADYTAGPARGRRAERVGPAGDGTGIVKTRMWGLGDAFAMPVTMVRMVKNAHPRGFMELDNGSAFSAENISELRAQLARIPGLNPAQRQERLNQYLATQSEGERLAFLETMGADAMARIARKHGLDPKAGIEIWERNRTTREGLRANIEQQYSAARMSRDGRPAIRVDAFEGDHGVTIHPNSVSRLINNHVLDDLAEFDRVIRRNAGSFQALRRSLGAGQDWITAAGDQINQLWKFSTLFRIGFIPRTFGDEIGSQMAALGAATMLMRAGYGVNNLVTNLVHRTTRGMDHAVRLTSQQAVDYAEGYLREITPQIRRLRGAQAAQTAGAERSLARATRLRDAARERLEALPADAPEARRAAHATFLERREAQLRAAQARTSVPAPYRADRLEELEAMAAELTARRDEALARIAAVEQRQQRAFQGSRPVTIGGQQFPAALAGSQRAEYYAKITSGTEAYDQLLATNRQLIHNNLLRSFDNGGRPIDAVADEGRHATAWARAINAQLAGDDLFRRMIAGATDDEAIRWLRSAPEGRAYWKRLGVESMSTPSDLVARARAEIDDYLPLPEIRQQALTPEGVTPEFLREAVPVTARPQVHEGLIGTRGIDQMRGVNRIMRNWYHFASSLPARTFSRHPLFNQLYEGHLKTVVSQRTAQGAVPRTVEEVERAAEVARRLAHRDMKKLVFDISHRSDAAAALRFISPFFSATTESFQRWGRLIADKPEILGYAQKFFNAPAYIGHLQTSEGYAIFPDGTYIDPVTGQRKLAPKDDRWIVGRMPEWLIDTPLGTALGVERSSGNFSLSQNSINLVTQGDPWFNPGFGPIVQIPVGEYVKDKPTQAELAQHLGILPFGAPSGGSIVERAAQSAAPSTIRNFLTAFDTSDYRYQQVKMQITQRAIFLHETQGIPMPSAQEIADQTREYWFFRAASSFIQPAATQQRDAFEFYRQQYRNLQRENPETADVEFLDRFGDDYFIFAQSMSKNEAGIQATNEAYRLSQQYEDVLQEFPELGSLIIGPEGKGPFSPAVYTYQLNHPLEPGDPEAQRRRLSAREMLEENNRRRGWAQYTSIVNGLNAQAVQRGLNSIHDAGAEDLEERRQKLVYLLGSPQVDFGNGLVDNPYYNEQWSTDWYSFDAMKYDRLIPQLDRVSREVLERDPGRSDMQALRVYLQGRQTIQEELSAREFTTLGAQANRDLRARWGSFVGQLTEASTDFGDLWSRYLSRDLGVDVTEEDAYRATQAQEEAA